MGTTTSLKCSSFFRGSLCSMLMLDVLTDKNEILLRSVSKVQIAVQIIE